MPAGQKPIRNHRARRLAGTCGKRTIIGWLGLRAANRILFLFIVHTIYALAGEPRPSTRYANLTTKAGFGEDRKERPDFARHFQNVHAQGGHLAGDLRFSHLTTRDGLALDNVVCILQDHRGFMWIGTGDGLNRYDGHSFVVYKNNPIDRGSLSANFIRDLVEDDNGHLWIAVYPGVNEFDPTTERTTRYLHDPNNRNSLSGDSVWSVTRDSRGYLWFATADSGLDRFDRATGTFTHYRNDSKGQSVGWITRVIEDRHRDIWFVGERGLFHLKQQAEQPNAPEIMKRLSANDLYEDKTGDFWMLAKSPIVGLVRYERQTGRLTEYPLGAGATLLDSSRFFNDGENGFWVPSSLGLSYFDRRTERFIRLFQHDDNDPDSLSDNSIVPLYRDRAGLLWVGTQNGGLNILNFQQEQFDRYMHRPGERISLSPGKVTAIYEDSNGVLWVGLFPRALDRIDPQTGNVTHYVPGPENTNSLSRGRELNGIFKDARGYLWVGGLGAGLNRFDERTGRFKHYRHNPGDAHSLQTDDVVSIYGDPSGDLWVGVFGGVSRFDPATDRFTNYRPGPIGSTSLAYTVSAIHRDRSGTLWLGTWGGVLSRYNDKTNSFVNYTPNLRDPNRLQGGSIGAIHEDRAGTLWLASGQGLYRYNRQNETFTRFTEIQGLPNVDIMGILEDGAGRLWISTKKGISRFDPRAGTFRNYDVSDGLHSNEFSRSCYQQGRKGEMFFCGSNGITAFFPDKIRDNPYVPPIVITSLKIFNKPVPIGPKAVLKKAIPYVSSLTLPYSDNVFSFEFAALSYANSQQNRYRYKLEGFDRGWNEVGSKQRLATYTNLDPAKYVFRVQGSNSDGVWNEAGVSLPILITPPWYRENWFLVLCATVFLALLWAAYRFRVRQLQHEFNLRLGERLDERGRIARELHDTLLQSVQGLMYSFQAARNLLPGRTEEAIRTLERAIREGDEAIAEGRDAIQGLRASPGGERDLEHLLTAAGKELARSSGANGEPPAFRVTVEGAQQPLSPILQDEVYRIAREILRNAFHHAHASRIEAEIAYDGQFFRLRIRDDGKGIDRKVLQQGARPGHWGLPGVRERAQRIGARLKLWSEPGAGTEAELTIPARIAYGTLHRSKGLRLSRKDKV